MTSLIVAVLLAWGASSGESQPPAKRPAGELQVEEVPPARPPKQFRGRLPAYYGSVVDEKQRQQIYAIQKQYFGQIEDLKAQLETVTKKRDADVAAVLSPEQKAGVERLKAEAKAKRDAKKGAGKG